METPIPRIIKRSPNGTGLFGIEDHMLSKRQIFLVGQISSVSVRHTIAQLLFLNSIESQEPITIFVDSAGGEVRSGLALFDVIQAIDAPVHTVCLGIAGSMASLLFLAGEKRSMLTHSQIMLHDPSYGNSSMSGLKPDEIQERVNDLNRVKEDLVTIIAEATNHPREEIYELTKKDTYFTAEEALEFGITTDLITRIS